MNKVVKRKLIGSIISIFIGVVVLAYVFLNNNIKEELNTYLIGFSSGIIFVGMIFLFQVFSAIKNPVKGVELENMQKDERIKMISDSAMSITGKISILVEAIVSISAAFLGKMEISECIGFIISIQLIVYLVAYNYTTNKN